MSGYSKNLSQKYIALKDNFETLGPKALSVAESLGIRDTRVLDFGCGDGRYAFEFLKRGAGEVVGIDSSPEMVRLAQKRLKSRGADKIHFLEEDGAHLSAPDDSFALVFSHFVLVHFKNMLPPLREIYRVLKPGGHLVCTFNTFTIDCEKLLGTEISLRLGNTDFVTVTELIKRDVEYRQALHETDFRISSYEYEVQPFLSINPGYASRSNILNMRSVICVAEKV